MRYTPHKRIPTRFVHGRSEYMTQRRRIILDAINHLSPEVKKDWFDAADRLVKKMSQRWSLNLSGGKEPQFGQDSALELLATIYSTNETVPCFDLPKG